ncbi:hypothetical protein D3C76_1743060 [compost metagenome]
MPITALAPIFTALCLSSFKAFCLEDISSLSYAPERPPNMLVIPAVKSFIKLTPFTTSPNSIPLYSNIFLPSTLFVVVNITLSIFNIS